MVVCPQCGKPQDGDVYVIGERDVSCSYCDWSGSSRELVIADDSATKDPQSFDLLADWLRDTHGTNIGLLMLEHKLIPPRVMKDQYELIITLRKIVRTYVAGITEAVLDPNILEKEEKFSCSHPFFLRSFGEYETETAKTMIELGIIKKSEDSRNIRYVTKVLRHAFRKMWAAIQELQEDEEMSC